MPRRSKVAVIEDDAIVDRNAGDTPKGVGYGIQIARSEAEQVGIPRATDESSPVAASLRHWQRWWTHDGDKRLLRPVTR